MYVCADYTDGRPPRLYRSVAEISADITEIKRLIADADEQLTVRSVLMEMISVWADESPEKWLPELEETVNEARCALESMKDLKSTLDSLLFELEEAKAIYGIKR